MNGTQYGRLMDFWRAHTLCLKAAVALEKAAVISVYAAFPCFLAVLAYRRELFALRALLVCAVSFVLLSLIRARLNKPRPYEVFGCAPALPKEKKGCSFPSRHVFSAAVISVCFFAACPPLGTAFFAVTAVIGLLRILLGVHFIRDVAAGAAAGVLCGVIGVYLLF